MRTESSALIFLVSLVTLSVSPLSIGTDHGIATRSAFDQVAFTNSIGMQFVRVEPGSFVMGSKRAGWIELPHNVQITSPFHIGRHEVTQEQWVSIMGSNPSDFVAPSHPVERVSWNDVTTFIRRLNERESGRTYRLPTEAEWEYAARAGRSFAYTETDSLVDLCQFANIADISGKADTTRVTVACDDGYVNTAPVGQFLPNSWGLFDMTGNVWEWIQDYYDDAYYARSPEVNPRGPASGTRRVLRGGGWGLRPQLYRLSFRFGVDPDYRSHAAGFRLVCDVSQE